MSRGEEQRPVIKAEALSMSLVGDSSMVTAGPEVVCCIRCGRLLTSKRSIPHGVGRECRRLLAEGEAA